MGVYFIAAGFANGGVVRISKLAYSSFPEIFDKFLPPQGAFQYSQQSLIKLFQVWTILW